MMIKIRSVSMVKSMVLAAAVFAASVGGAAAGTNFYVGVQGGDAWGDADKFFPDFGSKHVPVDADGFVLGVHAGVDVEIGRAFVGVEAGISFTDIAGGNITPGGVSCSTSVPPANQVVCRVSDVEALTTVSGRLGYDFGTVRAYITGGYATAEVSTDGIVVATGATVIPDSLWHDSWTYGAGLDWKADPEWILGLEFKHIELDGERHAAAFGAGNRHDMDLSLDLVQAKISYRFGGL
jgi:outer membrane immunogenic protein